MKIIGTVTTIMLTRKGIEFEAEVDHSISGRFRPAKTSGDPLDCYEAEAPEVEVFSVRAVNVRTMKPMPRPIKLTSAETRELETDLIGYAAAEAPEPDGDYDPEA